MPRTYLRPIPQERISVPSAWGFAGLTGIGGAVMLHQLVNPAAALFAFSNLVLYSFIYTPLKKYHSINTSVGALVGAVPPIIGWAANNGDLYSPQLWSIVALMYLWQMPHFHAICYKASDQYKKAGFKMMSVQSKDKVPDLCFKYVVAMGAMAPLTVATGLTTPAFGCLGLLYHIPLTYSFYKFKKTKQRERSLVLITYGYLFALLLTMAFLKNPKLNEQHNNKKNQLPNSQKMALQE